MCVCHAFTRAATFCQKQYINFFHDYLICTILSQQPKIMKTDHISRFGKWTVH